MSAPDNSSEERKQGRAFAAQMTAFEKQVATRFGTFDATGWDKKTTYLYMGIVTIGTIFMIIAMGMAGRGSDHAWISYDDDFVTSVDEAHPNNAIHNQDKVDIYFRDLDFTYQEVAWAFFGLIIFLAFSSIAMLSSGFATGAFISPKTMDIVQKNQIALTFSCVAAIMFIVVPLHRAYELENDELAGVHLTTYSREQNVFVKDGADNNGTDDKYQITIKHGDSTAVKLLTTGLLMIMLAPFVAAILDFVCQVVLQRKLFPDHEKLVAHAIRSTNVQLAWAQSGGTDTSWSALDEASKQTAIGYANSDMVYPGNQQSQNLMKWCERTSTA